MPLAREGVQRFGMIRGRGPGEQRWSSYNVLNRVSPDEVVERVLRARRRSDPAGLAAHGDGAGVDLVAARARVFEQSVEAEVGRRAAEVRGPQHVARHTVRPTVEQVDFTAARTADLELTRREIEPLARRLAIQLSREQHARSRGQVDFRRTVRASMSSGGVPLETRHRRRRPGRTDLVVLGDARFNHSDLALPVVADLVHATRHAWWLNPEHARHWGTGDSAAGQYGRLVPMVECRNLTQLGAFVHDLA